MSEAIRIPGYRIDRKLGQGGMASVYLAVQESFERRVALKIMSPALDSDPSFAERFLREARIVANLSHASIVPVFEVGEHGPYHYLSMEYLPAGDLKTRIVHGERSLNLALDVCMALSAALDIAQRKGFVHRDIKPENILFREDGTPVLTDFGIARAVDRGRALTLQGTLVGTPNYMSPEQVKGLELDGRSDLYSLGVVFYEILTGDVPFHADSSLSVALKHVSDPLPALPKEFASFQEFLDRLTAKDPEARFATGADVIRELRQLASRRSMVDRTLVRPAASLETTLRSTTTTAAPSPLTTEDTAAQLQGLSSGQTGSPLALPKVKTSDRPSRSKQKSSDNRKAKTSERPRRAPKPDPARAATRPRRRGKGAWIGVGLVGAIVAGVALMMARGHLNNTALTGVTRPTLVSGDVARPPSAPDVNDPRKRAEEHRQRMAEEARLVRKRAAELNAEGQEAQIQQLLAAAKKNLAAGTLWQPAGACAADRYRAILKIRPSQPEALAGARRLAKVLVDEVQHSEAAGDIYTSTLLLAQLRSLQSDNPKLPELQGQLRQMQDKPPELDAHARGRLERAAAIIAKAQKDLGRTPLDGRVADDATDAYDRAILEEPMAPGLPSLKVRLIAAYAIAAQTELSHHDTKRALNLIATAHKRSWSSAELDQIEASLPQQTPPPAASAAIHPKR